MNISISQVIMYAALCYILHYPVNIDSSIVGGCIVQWLGGGRGIGDGQSGDEVGSRISC